MSVEAEKKIITIKSAVQPASGSHHPKTFVGMLAGNPSTQMADLVSIFRSEEINSTVAEEMEEYALASAEVAYEDLGRQVPMVFLASGG